MPLTRKLLIKIKGNPKFVLVYDLSASKTLGSCDSNVRNFFHHGKDKLGIYQGFLHSF